MEYTPQELPKRFRDRIDVQANGCWHWRPPLDRHGYGHANWERVKQAAHRVVYKILVGPIPPGLQLDHTCHDPNMCVPPCIHRRCVNPAHLEPVTPAENLRRSGARRAVSEKFAVPRDCPQGHPMTGDNLHVATTKDGHRNYKCKTCNRDAQRRWKAKRAAQSQQTL